jgi:putative endonuclease
VITNDCHSERSEGPHEVNEGFLRLHDDELYTGITNSLMRRVWQHQSGEIEGFTKTYRANRLVDYECFDNPRDAIAREKEIKGWRRQKKNALVEMKNPKWADLSPMLFLHFKSSSRASAATDRRQ